MIVAQAVLRCFVFVALFSDDSWRHATKEVDGAGEEKYEWPWCYLENITLRKELASRFADQVISVL